MSNNIQQSPEEAKLTVVVGDWKDEGVVHPGRFGPRRNSLGILLVYQGYWEETRLIFDLVHPHPDKSSRVVYETFPDGTFEMRSETAETGDDFKPYFETQFLPSS